MSKNETVTNTASKLLNIKQASEAMGLAVQTLYSWVSQKRIAHIKAGRKVLFDPRDIEAWKEQNKVLPRPELPEKPALTNWRQP